MFSLTRCTTSDVRWTFKSPPADKGLMFKVMYQAEKSNSFTARDREGIICIGGFYTDISLCWREAWLFPSRRRPLSPVGLVRAARRALLNAGPGLPIHCRVDPAHPHHQAYAERLGFVRRPETHEGLIVMKWIPISQQNDARA